MPSIFCEYKRFMTTLKIDQKKIFIPIKWIWVAIRSKHWEFKQIDLCHLLILFYKLNCYKDITLFLKINSFPYSFRAKIISIFICLHFPSFWIPPFPFQVFFPPLMLSTSPGLTGIVPTLALQLALLWTTGRNKECRCHQRIQPIKYFLMQVQYIFRFENLHGRQFRVVVSVK